jgi:hypothetical protein
VLKNQLEAVASAQADNWIAKTHRQNQHALRFGRFGFVNVVWRSTVFGLLRSPKTQPPGGRLPTLRLPTRFGVQFKLVRFYYAQRRAGRPRSSPRRFAAIVGVADIGVLVLPMCVGDPVVGLRRRYSPRKPGGRLPTLHLPIRFGVPFKLFWCYYTQRRAGRPRSSPLRYSYEAIFVCTANHCHHCLRVKKPATDLFNR